MYCSSSSLSYIQINHPHSAETMEKSLQLNKGRGDEGVSSGEQQGTKRSPQNSEERRKAIGKRTRELLDMERRRRKEIVRIDGGDLDLDLGKRSSSSRSSFSKSVMKQTSKRRKTSTTRLTGPTSTTSYKNSKTSSQSNADQWFPETEHLLRSYKLLPNDQKSNVVRLYGLPIGVRIEHVLKFFAGLSPQRIFVLPTLDETIQDFDLSDDSYDENRRKTVSSPKHYVKRHSNHFRVFVKFQSYPIADSALSRSGEVIHVDENTAAAIAVTPISKTVAVHLQKFMGIDAKKGDELQVLLDETEDEIPKIVGEILWSMFRQEIGMHFSKEVIGGGSYPPIQTSELYNIFPPSTKQGHCKIVNLYNNLVDIYEELEKECTPFMMQEYDPYLTKNSSMHRLLKTATTWILDQCDMIKKCLESYHRYK